MLFESRQENLLLITDRNKSQILSMKNANQGLFSNSGGWGVGQGRRE